MADLQGKVVVITGASRGIGAAAAQGFAQAGAHVALLARSAAAIEAVAADLPGPALALPCDVSDYTQVKAAIDAVIAQFGRLDVLVNNAGAMEPIARIEDANPEDWAKIVDINLKGVLYGIHAALPQMRAQGGGTVLNISSGAAYGPVEGWSHYCASKAGALMLTRCLDHEERANGIRSIGLSPGTVATQMQREIKASGINPVSQLNWSDHIPPEWPAVALQWMCSSEADAYLGQDISLRDPEIRARLGLSE